MKNFIFYLFLFIFILLTILGIFANFISPFNPNLNDFSNVNLNSNFTHFLVQIFLVEIFFQELFLVCKIRL